MWLSPGLDCTSQGQELYSALLWVHSIYPVWSLPSASHHCCSVAKLSPILCDPKDCSTPVSPSLTISLSLLRFMSTAEKEMATHSTILAWRILWTGEPGGLLSMGLHRVRHDWSDFTCMHALEREMATHSSILTWRIPGTGEPGGLLSVGSHRVGHDWSDLEAAACPLSQWCHPAISSSVIPFSCLQSFPAWRSFPVSRLFTSGGQSVGASASASVLPMNIQGWFPLGLTGLVSLLSKGL